MAFGIDKLAEDIACDVEARIHFAHDHYTTNVDSPIEKLFLAGVQAATRFINAYTEFTPYEHRGTVPSDAEMDGACFLLTTQARVIDWPVDFLLTVRRECDGRLLHLAVECDGHDFHERTKEQAARDRSRDRALQARGVRVMRFTGSEIYRDPLKCVSEALDWCLGARWGRPE